MAARILIICLFLSGQPMSVVRAAEASLVFPPGLDSCQIWMQGRRQTDAAQIARQAWVLGFVTAANAFTQAYGHSDGNLTKSTDTEGLYAWIDDYCSSNPRYGLSRACTALVNDLSARN